VNVQTLQLEPFGLQLELPSSQQKLVARSQTWPPHWIVFFVIVALSPVEASGTVPEDEDEDEVEDEVDVPPEAPEELGELLDASWSFVCSSGAAPLPFRSSNDGNRQPARTAAAPPIR